ncbi:Protein phosphatase 2C [Rubrobacter radiotolerans]|uniref:Protein phosphatase 2C n=1 Tax=Rubrobacter radiotolerans TaxID=42256 RepID=A0A023WZR9_RUBRA|nr:Stp1/IreP family PP2C-type Ser/Thr phosphatase [Rubrobacter radiotolerans]AHY45309.1 Protein phosphatase 2C [Rubrobacter radiotolerans]MDX5892721.1 Stp1/IreP family PP2C-type Ser/Thr phosphatase [Rubrobacter radiotolerans]SMC02348.1 protein phosphatase [Rubrobacter radiotolerans DSM 5868]
MFYLEHFGLTDPGRVRENNEDSLLVGEGVDETLFAVADGIGGFEAGEVASRMAIDALKKMTPEDKFEAVIPEANRRIRTAAKGDERLSGMGTTVVAIRFGGTRRRPLAEIAHVGDSRAYLLRGDKMRPITEDHSLVAELVRSGDITRDEAAAHPQKNLITRALGAEEKVEVDTAVIPIEAGDRILLCSDGLSDMVREERISEVLLEHPRDPEAPAKILMQEALEAGGSDNITIVVVDVRERRNEGSSGTRNGTQELPAVAGGMMASAIPGAAVGAAANSRTAGQKRNRLGRAGSGRREKRDRSQERAGRRAGKASGRGPLRQALRVLAVLALAGLALAPIYAWGSTRYYLEEAQNGEVVAYRGVPFVVPGLEIPLSSEWRRTGVDIEEVNESFRAPIRENTLYTEGDIEEVIAQLQSDAESNAAEEETPADRAGQGAGREDPPQNEAQQPGAGN